MPGVAVSLRRSTRRAFAAGVITGIALLFAGRYAINKTPFADWIVRPLVRADTTGPADAIVVLGAGIVGDCAPNLNAVRRVLLTARLWRQGLAPLILVTGGPPRGEPCPVAAVMADLLYELGVPRDRVLLETASRSTHENAALSAPVLRAHGARRLLLVTDRLHVTRAAGVFAHYGFVPLYRAVPVYEGHADNVSMLAAAFREAVALAYYRLRGWLSMPAGASLASAGGALSPNR